MSGEGVVALGRVFVETPEGRRLLPLIASVALVTYASTAGLSALLWVPAVAALLALWLYLWLRNSKKSSGGFSLALALIAVALLALVAGVVLLFRRRAPADTTSAPPNPSEVDALAQESRT